jgi:hypothetical protein
VMGWRCWDTVSHSWLEGLCGDAGR